MPKRQKPGPKLNQAPPAYRHYKPKNLAVVRINGKDHYLGRYDSPESWERYHRLLAEVAVKGTVETPTATTSALTKRTVNEIANAYLDHAEAYYVKNGRQTSEVTIIKQALVPLFKLYARLPAEEFGPLALKAVRKEFIQSKRLCRTEINRRVKIIVRMFKWAGGEELVPPSLYHGLLTVGGLRKGRETGLRESAPIKPVADDRVDAVQPFVARQVWAMIELQRFTGMRPGEVTIIRTCDLDRSGDVWTYTPESHKTEHHERARVISIGPRAQAVLQPWLRADTQAYLFQPAEAQGLRAAAMRENRKSKVQPSQKCRQHGRGRRYHDRYSTTAYHHAIARGCNQAFPHPKVLELRAEARRKGLTREERRKAWDALAGWKKENSDDLKDWRKRNRWHPNQLRHSTGTKIRKAFDLDAARAVLGHSEAKTTLTYAEHDNELAAKVIAEVG